ncbi:MAG: hypothetical protein IPJ69_02000 [Deltaproteobacteria bacterium]|nr:MAG: hypothetical protein IPJ69_02000 [Deltaproteobacteria bacterium]
MTSEAIKEDFVPLSAGKWVSYRQEGNGYRILRELEFLQMPILQLVSGAYIVKFDLPKHGQIYFVGLNDELFNKLTSEGKQVYWLHQLFQRIQDQLYLKNNQDRSYDVSKLSTKLQQDKMIFSWTINDLWIAQGKREDFTQLVMDVFPGSRRVVV